MALPVLMPICRHDAVEILCGYPYRLRMLLLARGFCNMSTTSKRQMKARWQEGLL